MENQDELCAGVKILIERMKTHPEEFEDIGSTIGTHKWNGVMSSSMWDEHVTVWDDVLTPNEVAALKEARANIMRKKFTSIVMARLLKDQEESKGEKVKQSPYPSGGYFQQVAGGGGGLSGNGYAGMLAQGQRVASTGTHQAQNAAQSIGDPYQYYQQQMMLQQTQQKAKELGMTNLLKKVLKAKNR